MEELRPGFETGNVRLIRRIGAGAMGSVWMAQHLTLSTRVAVKFVSSEESEPVTLARFAREASTIAQLKSPYVVQVYDRAATVGGSPYMVMELLEGETLGKYLSRRKRASFAIARRVVEHVGKALAKAHGLGVVHRDIKSDNIFLTRGDEGALVCKVLDFGIAKLDLPKGGLTSTGSMVGTPAFMSPEQFADSSSVDEHADLWALGVVAYLCFTGERPFRGSDMAELCSNIAKGRFTRVGALREELPNALDDWFARRVSILSARPLPFGHRDGRRLSRGAWRARPGRARRERDRKPHHSRR
jgi:serine/threonine protein kinase